jgi:SAM-dependent methyltransferase
VTAFDASERRIWTGRAEAYAGSFAKLCAYPVPLLLDAAGVRSGVRVLDVGTGTGTAARAARERGAESTAVDADPGMAAPASAAVPDADVRVAALPGLPFADDGFDAVVGDFVLNHAGRPRVARHYDALSEEFTAPDGSLVLRHAAPLVSGSA